MTMPAWKHALLSRILMISLCILSGLWVADYDTSGEAAYASNVKNSVDKLIRACFAPFARWDALYYVHIAEEGYTHENLHAFYPGFPLMLRLSGAFIELVTCYQLSLTTCILMGGVLLNNGFFVLSTHLIYHLSLIAHNVLFPSASTSLQKQRQSRRVEWRSREVFAWRAALCFAYQPASIFYSVLYTESLFTLLVLVSMACLLAASGKNRNGNGEEEEEEKKFCYFYYWLSVLFLTAASAVRSNGVVLFLILLGERLRWCGSVRCLTPGRCLQMLETLVIGGCFIALPHVTMQVWGASRYIVPNSTLFGLIPAHYQQIQATYWNQGLFHYWTVAQLPNFLLAAPIWWWTFCMLRQFYPCFLSVGVRQDDDGKGKGTDTEGKMWLRLDGQGTVGWFIRSLFVIATLLTVVSIVSMHVQVATRFLSFNPILYWYLGRSDSAIRYYQWYSLIFWACGIALHPNFYPWT
jgi:GPI mannosyltransferase 2